MPPDSHDIRDKRLPLDPPVREHGHRSLPVPVVRAVGALRLYLAADPVQRGHGSRLHAEGNQHHLTAEAHHLQGLLKRGLSPAHSNTTSGPNPPVRRTISSTTLVSRGSSVMSAPSAGEPALALPPPARIR